MDAVDLDSLAWRAVELAVQRRHDPRLIVATRPAIGGPVATARLVAGLCNAAGGRLAIALFGVDGTDVLGVDEPPDETWLDTVAARFPGVVPALATATIDADGARIVALAADDPGTLVVATRAGRAIIPWFDGALTDQPPAAGIDHSAPRPPGRLEARTGWIERIETCASDGRSGPTADEYRAGDGTQAGSGVVVWQGILDIALELDTLTDSADLAEEPAPDPSRDRAGPGGLRGTGRDVGGALDEALAEPAHGGPRSGRPVPTRREVTIADRDVSVTLLAEGSNSALSLEVQIHPGSRATSAVRAEGGVLLDPTVPCRLYLAAAVDSPAFDHPGDLGEAVRLLISIRFPGDDRLVATMAVLRRDPADVAVTRRWTLSERRQW